MGSFPMAESRGTLDARYGQMEDPMAQSYGEPMNADGHQFDQADQQLQLRCWCECDRTPHQLHNLWGGWATGRRVHRFAVHCAEERQRKCRRVVC